MFLMGWRRPETSVHDWFTRNPKLLKGPNLLDDVQISRLIITPTKAYCLPLEVELSNWVLRQCKDVADRFLRVTFLDEGMLLLHSIVDSGFEHPSQGNSFLPTSIWTSSLGLAYAAYQICHEFERFSTYLPDVKIAVFYGGVSIKIHKNILKNECPHVVVGTTGRILALARDKDLSLRNVSHFILDECDKMLESLDMRRDVQEIFKMTPHDKQVTMFSKEICPVYKKFMQYVMSLGQLT
ncbi:hypothetical protein Dimus_019360 [Dionaea muscipula]